jgi:hypothetical protein
MADRLPEVEHATLRCLLDWWEDRRGGRPMPSRADLDPADLRPILPDLVLVDVDEEAPTRFQYRLAGTEIDAALGYPIGGHGLADLPILDGRAEVLEQYERTVASRRPTFGKHKLILEGTRPRLVHYICVLVPLSDGGSRVDTLVGAAVFLASRAA